MNEMNWNDYFSNNREAAGTEETQNSLEIYHDVYVDENGTEVSQDLVIRDEDGVVICMVTDCPMI